MANQERDFIKKRQKEGIEIALSKGVKFGRPKIEKPSNFDEVVFKWINKEIKSKEAMQLLNLKPNTFYNFINNSTNIRSFTQKV